MHLFARLLLVGPTILTAQVPPPITGAPAYISVSSPECMAQLKHDGEMSAGMQCDFSGMDLAYKDFSYAHFTGAHHA